MRALINSLAATIFLVGVGAVLFYAIDSTPEMAWSHSKNRCVSVTQRGETIPNGCARIARGELRAERYYVK